MFMGNNPFKNILDVIYVIDHCHKLLKVIEHCQITGKNQEKMKNSSFLRDDATAKRAK
jgi:hypothetical protein